MKANKVEALVNDCKYMKKFSLKCDPFVAPK